MLSFLSFIYQKLLRPLLFLVDSEKVHTFIIFFGEKIGNTISIKKRSYPQLRQLVTEIRFENPIGLAAGFDYEARLTQVLPALDFGFGTVGTITKNSYQGNPSPMLGRLPKSQSLMVNKGFKNLGAAATISKISNLNFQIPTGVSIGSREASIADIAATFKRFEQSPVKHTYYELNISCPNLQTKKNFYSPQNLEQLLIAIDKLKIKKPIFVKMPIGKTDKEFLSLLQVIAKHCPKGVIIGNLQTNREKLHPSEQQKYSVGNFSGKPCFERSNELISLAYKHFKNKLIIIGCGGVFSAADAWEKITRGATLVQLITGLVYQGPQLVSQINLGLLDLLKQSGYKNISGAVGSKVI